MKSTRNSHDESFLYLSRAWHPRTSSNFNYAWKLRPFNLSQTFSSCSVMDVIWALWRLRQQSEVKYLQKQRFLTQLLESLVCDSSPRNHSGGKDFSGQKATRCIKSSAGYTAWTIRDISRRLDGKDALCADAAWPRSRSSGSSPPAWGICRVRYW